MNWSAVLILLLLQTSNCSGIKRGGKCGAAKPGRRQLSYPPVCKNVYQVECQKCQTVFQRVCGIEMKETAVERTVRKCRKYRNANCKDGYREKCKTSFSSHCSTVMKIAEVMEDQPVCRTENIDSCSSNSSDCREVEVNRCHIESRTVRRAQPETRCERIPAKLCDQQKCKKGRVECSDELVTGVEQVPVESCQFIPQQVCKQVEDSCRTIMKRICRSPRRRNIGCRRRNGGQKGGNGIQVVGRRKGTETQSRKRKQRGKRKLIIV